MWFGYWKRIICGCETRTHGYWCLLSFSKKIKRSWGVNYCALNDFFKISQSSNWRTRRVRGIYTVLYCLIGMMETYIYLSKVADKQQQEEEQPSIEEQEELNVFILSFIV